MKRYTTNEILRDLFLKENCSQVEFANRADSDKNSIHDWLRNKNQMKFSKLEELLKSLGKTITITIK